ncbi:MAG: ribulose-phosphate 3-epimerase, partial [Butyrivibrio sp.]|nr:ribulose-phosphate 3-epimerase [Butyrivibrio sp.]
ISRIREVRKMLIEKNLSTDVEVDGGIYTENVNAVLEAGANVIVSGSGVFKGNPKENVKKFLEILETE